MQFKHEYFLFLHQEVYTDRTVGKCSHIERTSVATCYVPVSSEQVWTVYGKVIHCRETWSLHYIVTWYHRALLLSQRHKTRQ